LSKNGSPLEIDQYEVYENWDFETQGILKKKFWKPLLGLFLNK
jgi:hypothetical protein